MVNTLIYVAPFGMQEPGLIVRGFWGLFFGAFVAPVVFGVTLTIVGGQGVGRLVGRWVASITLLLFALLIVWWISAWGVSPFTLEGWWIYGLGIVAVIGAVLASRGRASRASRSERAGRDLRF